MHGYFQHAQVAITAPNGEGVSSWIIHAEAISYEITETGVITLRITQEKNSVMLGEPGNLTIDSTNIVKRNLRKARFVKGKPLLIN